MNFKPWTRWHDGQVLLKNTPKCDRTLAKKVLVAACFILIATVLSMFLVDMVHAQTVTGLPSFESVQSAAGVADDSAGGDKSRYILKTLLGAFGNNPFTVGAATSLLGMLFFIFNAVLFVIGGAYIGYNVIVAVAVSAQDGEVLGKRMSGLWIPIRLSLGVFGMIPVFVGFSLSQAVMMSMAILGVGMANLLVTEAISAADKFSAAIPPPGIATSAASSSIDAKVGNTLFLMHVCSLASEDYSKVAGSNRTRKYQASVVIDNYGGLVTTGGRFDCGSIVLNNRMNSLRSNSDTLAMLHMGGFRISSVNYDSINSVAQNIFDARKSGLAGLNTDIKTAASEWYLLAKDGVFTDYPLAAINTAIYNAASAESTKITSAMTSGADGRVAAFTATALDNMKQGGWMGIGAWYATFAEANAALQTAAMSSGIETIPPNVNNANLPITIQNALQMLSIQKKKAEETCALGMVNINATGNCSPAQNSLNWVLESFIGNTGGTGMINPIIACKNIGDYLLSAVGLAAGIYTAKELAEFAKSLTPTGLALGAAEAVGGGAAKKVFGDLLTKTGGFATSLLLAAFFMGLIYAVYIPFIPFLTWFSALVSYFASVIEGLVAAQVWAFSHLNTEGEGMGQQANRGYLYILNMLLRPGLMVLGFFIASALLSILGTFFFQEFATALANVQGDTMTGVFIMMGVVAIVMITMVALIQSIFNLVYELPDRVIAWFGHGMEARMGREMDQKIEGKTEQASRWAGTAVIANGMMRRTEKNS